MGLRVSSVFPLLPLGLFLVSSLATSPSLAQPLELDANAVDDSGPGLPEDWDVVVTGGGTPMFGFLADPAGETIFSGAGSRDTQDITSWTWINGVVPSKDEITNAFFAYYEAGFFYFGADRFSNAGAAYMGFWLLQDQVSLNPDGTFSGAHVDGDILILVDFAPGGLTEIVPRVYEWNAAATVHLVELTGLTGAAYAVINTVPECSPWSYTPNILVACPAPCSGGDCFPQGSFIEGGIDLRALSLAECFRFMIAETRSSQLTSAQLKDLAILPINIIPGVVVTDICEGIDLCAEPTGGSGVFSYLWNTGATTRCLMNPDPGAYTVTVTDDSTGCVALANGVVIDGPDVLVDPVCEGSQLCATVGGGAPPYVFTWSSGHTTQCIANPTTGIYFLTVTDANGCTSAATGRVLPASICPELCVQFTAVVTLVDDNYGLLTASGIGVGDPATGQYVYNPLTPDTNALPTVGDYFHTTPAFGIEVNVAGMTFETDPANVDFLLEMVNDHGAPPEDNYLLISYNNLTLPGGPAVDYISWQLDDPTALAVSTDAIPISPPNLADWQSLFGLTIEGANPSNADETFFLRLLVTQDGYCGPTAGIEPDPIGPATLVSLLPAYPNPFVTRTRISFTLAEEAPVRVNLVAVNGRLVRSLYQGNLNAGAWSFPWDGRDDQGRRVPAGVYLVHLVAGDQRQSGRIIRIE